VGKNSQTGKRVQKTVSGFKNEKEARKACDKMLRDIEKGKRVDTPTVEEFITMFYEKKAINQISREPITAIRLLSKSISSRN
jgi:hypothetical protein